MIEHLAWWYWVVVGFCFGVGWHLVVLLIAVIKLYLFRQAIAPEPPPVTHEK
jgi:hypothetical protein